MPPGCAVILRWNDENVVHVTRQIMSNETGKIPRHIRPIPNRLHVGLTIYDAKNPGTKLPPIEPLHPPEGMVRISLDGGVVPDHHVMAGPGAYVRRKRCCGIR